MTETPRAGPRYADLGVRILSAAVLATIAYFAFLKGGAYATALAALGAGLMVWEFRRLVIPALGFSDTALWAMVAAAAAAVLVTGAWALAAGLVVLLAGLAAVAALDRTHWRWMVPGTLYIGLAMAVLIAIRADPAQGFARVLWLVAVVIAADVGGYFAGRHFGGPKLWPRVSPKKTWAGSLGGLALALLVGALFWLAGQMTGPQVLLLSVVLALASQAGDLLESAVKRHFGVKDASRLIPGHGGLLDRFDGLLGALWIYAALRFSGIVGV